MASVPWGGSEELWSRAALLLKRNGHAVAASVEHWPSLSHRVRELALNGIAVHVRRPSAAPLIRRVWWAGLAQCGISTEQSWLRSLRPDLVVISQGAASDGRYWMERCAELKLRYVVISQCNSEIWWPSDDRAEALLNAYRGAERAYFVSTANKELFQDQIGEELPNAEVVWNPVNLTSNAVAPWPGNTDMPAFASVARLDPAAKGQDVLFRVLSAEKWRNRKVRMHLYGDGPCRQQLEKSAARLKLESVRFCGHVTDLHRVWSENHLLILPSRYEGLPLALIEGMLCGRAAIVTDVGGNAELIDDGTTGFLCAAAKPALLDAAMERAWTVRSHWEEMGAEARRRLLARMPLDPVATFVDKLLGCVHL